MSDWAAAAAETVQRQRLRVLVLGGAVGSPGGEKRSQIAQHIANLGSGDEVGFAEELIANEPTLQDVAEARSLYDAEMLLVHEADAVVAVMMPFPNAPGVNTELEQFLTHATLRHKFLVVMPSETRSLMRRNRPYSLDQLSRLDNQQTFPYTSQQLTSCTAIRAWIEKRLNGVRADKALRELGA